MWAAAAIVMFVLIAMAILRPWRRFLPVQAAGTDMIVHSSLTSVTRQPCHAPYSTPALWSALSNFNISQLSGMGHGGCEAHVIQTHFGDVVKFFMCIIIQHIL